MNEYGKRRRKAARMIVKPLFLVALSILAGPAFAADQSWHCMQPLGTDAKGPVFAMSVAPGFAGTVSPNSDQPATATIFSAQGEFARATQICVRFVGDF